MPLVQTFHVVTSGSTTALPRIVATCARYQCAITAMSWRQDAVRGEMVLTLTGQRGQLSLAQQRVHGLVEVLEAHPETERSLCDAAA